MSLQIPDAELDEWMAVLKPYQRSTLQVYLTGGTPEEAAERWLAGTGSPNLATFGGPANTKPFWDNFKSEFRKFLCDDAAYQDEKRALALEAPLSKTLLVSVVSAAIGAQIGFTATLLAPAVTILLFTAGKMSLAAFCATSP